MGNTTITSGRCYLGITFFSASFDFMRFPSSPFSLFWTMASNFNVVFVLGAPGAGKGTQCAKIVERYGFVHLSAGDLLRAERQKPESAVGDMINNHIRNGTIVPVEVTCSLIEKAMIESGSNRFLVDGFPRNKDNLDGWNSVMEGKATVRCVVFLDCPQKVCLERCLARGAAGSGRLDDNVESLTKRFDTYMNSTMPIIEHYDKMSLVHRFDAARSPDQVFSDVEKVFDGMRME